jgi:hypothetical protein
MEQKNYTGLIPENKEGKEITAEASVTFKDAAEAKAFYKIASERLLDINNWGKRAGSLSADFQLTDEQGNEANRLARKGDYFRVDIPGPGSSAGEGYDWVVAEDIKEVNEKNTDSLAIKVRPASNPQTDNKNIAHFYSEKSTSTFVITRENNKVTASIYDRDIQSNTDTGEGIDKVRNAVTGLGAKHTFSKLQWKALAEALVKQNN